MIIPVVYHDEHLLIVHKPAGLLTVPGRTPDLQDCLWSRLKARFPDREVRLVHRLDRDTSGLVIFALSKEAQAKMGRRFERRQVRKEYAAEVWGAMEADTGVVDAPITKDWTRNDPPVYVVDRDKGREAVTRFQVVEREADSTRVRLFPETGRSHQLRVHLLHLGHPIVGDPIYGPPEPEGRMKLCACRLEFYHPLSGKPVGVGIGVDF